MHTFRQWYAASNQPSSQRTQTTSDPDSNIGKGGADEAVEQDSKVSQLQHEKKGQHCVVDCQSWLIRWLLEPQVTDFVRGSPERGSVRGSPERGRQPGSEDDPSDPSDHEVSVGRFIVLSFS